MNKIGIITDSSSDIPEDLLAKYEIEMISTRIIYENKEYRERLEISSGEIYDKFDEEIPKTSMPLPKDFFNAVENLRSKGVNKIICVFISSGLSGTYNNMKTLSESVEGIDFEFLDSKSLSLGLGIIPIELSKCIANGMNFSETVEFGKRLVNSTKVYFVLKTLHYLRVGGRIGFVEGTIGDLLNIKPLITIEHSDGKYRTKQKIRGSKKILVELKKLVSEESSKFPIRVAVMHGKLKDEADNLLEYVKTLPGVKEVYSGQISPVLSVHTGPGLIGVVVQKII